VLLHTYTHITHTYTHTGVTHLSPTDDYMLGPDDALLLMAEGAENLNYNPRLAIRVGGGILFWDCLAPAPCGVSDPCQLL